MWRALLFLVLLAAALRKPAPVDAWRPEDNLDLDKDLDLDHDHDLDDDVDDFLSKDGVNRIRLPNRLGDETWDADFEKILQSESPWLPGKDGKDGKESYEEFVKRFSSEAPVEEQELDGLDEWN